LTDIQMPNTDGFSVLKSLKEGKIDSYKNQPVIAMTGSREHGRDFYLEKGFSEMLSKPFSKQALIKVLKGIFKYQPEFSEESGFEKIKQTETFTSEEFDLSL